MELIERDHFLAALRAKFDAVAAGEGHCVLVTGEAGIGKSSLVKAFCQQKAEDCSVFEGMCDAFITPRPLAPFYEVAWQMGGKSLELESVDRTQLFTYFFQQLSALRGIAIIVIEDIHWIDEASLDFIRFLARRIARVRCLFILTYRDNEIHSRHPLRGVIGQLPADAMTRLPLPPLSREAVEAMATQKGYSGKEVYGISGGIPFYVNEILAAYSPGVPDNIRDAVVSVYDRQPVDTKKIWEILSAMPAGFEIVLLARMEPEYATAISDSLEARILILEGGRLFFKHELYRRAIEASLSPLARIALHRRVLELFLVEFENQQQLERVIHHAELAQDYRLVGHYAPLAAKQAATVGSHLEAAKLFLTAINHFQGNDPDGLLRLYEGYAYECYLTNRMKEAIAYQERVLAIREQQGDIERIGDCLRFLSRLWWYNGNRKHAEEYAEQAVEVLKDQPASQAKAMAFSNMSQLKMLANQSDEALFWGEKAILLARELGDNAILSHALNNVGTTLTTMHGSLDKGRALQQQGLAIALQYSYHEHAARAYTNLGSTAFQVNDLGYARQILEEGIRYCEERDLDSWVAYMCSCKARLLLRTGEWAEARGIAETILLKEDQAPIVRIGALVVIATVQTRRGEAGALESLREARELAFAARELQRIVPVLAAMLEYEWITGEECIVPGDIDETIVMIGTMGNLYDSSEFAFWLNLGRKRVLSLDPTYDGYLVSTGEEALRAATMWSAAGCGYQQALCLFAAGEAEKRVALALAGELGAVAVCRRMKADLRAAGVRGLPRGIRETTRSNVASLTQREVEVLKCLKDGLRNKEIAARLFISAKTVDHHISSLLLKLDVSSRVKAVNEAVRLRIIE